PHSITAEFAIYNADGEQIAAVREARFKSIRLSKTAAEALDFVADSGVPSPHPMDPRRHISALDSTAVRTAFSALAETLAAEQTHARYALEIEPLLDSL